jgi:PTS system mannitol-specific IIC component
MGNLLAIPHGTNEAKSSVRRTAMSFIRYSDPIDWNGKETKFVVGIAGTGDEHLALLGQIARVFVDPARVAELESARTPVDVMRVLGVVGEQPSAV